MSSKKAAKRGKKKKAITGQAEAGVRAAKLGLAAQDGDCAALHAPLTARPAAAPSPAEAAGGAGADNAPPAADGKADIASPIKSQGAGPSAAEERSEIAAAIEIDNEADIQRYRESERITND